MAESLKKPIFCKVADIKPGKHCYHVYAKIVEVRHTEREGKKNTVKVAEGVLGDETAVANFKFTGEQCDMLKEGAVVAIRNGLSSVVSEHILLEVDKFGLVTLEKDQSITSVNKDQNISKNAYVPREQSK